jgi:hypothetical protein
MSDHRNGDQQILVRRKRLLWIGVGIAVVGIAFLVFPPYGAYCESNHANNYYCAAYEVTVALGAFVDSHNGAVTAIATIFIGLFTYTLKRATDKLWSAGERQLEHAKREFTSAETGRQVQFDQITEQLGILRQSTEAAEASARATRDLVRSEEKRTQLELRAYIGIEWAKVISNDWGNTFIVEIQIKNAGQTPAFRVTHRITAQVFPPGQPPNLAIPNKSPGELPIAPGTAFVMRTPIVLGGAAEIDVNKRFIISWGRVDYFDIIGFPRHLEFRFRSRDAIRAHDGTIMRTVGWRLDAEDQGNTAS